VTTQDARFGSGVQLAALLAAAVITNVAYTILIPFVPMLEKQFTMTSFEVGGIFAGFAVTKALLQPAGGILVDRYEARTVACGGLLTSAAAMVLLSGAHTAEHIIVLRVAWGIGEGLTVPALFRLCFTIHPSDPVAQGRVIGWFGSAEVAGMAAGPALVGVFEPILAFQGIVLLAASITVAGALLLLACMGSSKADTDHQPPSGGAQQTIPGLQAMAVPLLAIVGAMAVVDFANNFVYAALEPGLPLYVADRFTEVNPLKYISVLFFLGLLTFSLTAAISGQILNRLGLPWLIAVAFAIATAGLTAQALATGPIGIAAGFIVFMVSQPLIYTAARAVIAAVPKERQGRTFGYFGLVSEFGWVFGPLAGAPMARALGSEMFLGFAAATGVICLLAAGVAVSGGWPDDPPKRPLDAGGMAPEDKDDS
jgi:MFS family permease